MKRYSKILVLLLLFTLAFTLTACQVEEGSGSQQIVKQQLTTEPKEEAQYLLTKEIYKDDKEEAYSGVFVEIEYDYNNQEQITEIVYKNKDGKVMKYKEYKYDDENKLIYCGEKNKNGKKVKWIKFKYYTNGQMKLKYTEDINGSKEKNYFDENGRLIKTIQEYSKSSQI
jgi:predicted small secreted protein